MLLPSAFVHIKAVFSLTCRHTTTRLNAATCTKKYWFYFYAVFAM